MALTVPIQISPKHKYTKAKKGSLDFKAPNVMKQSINQSIRSIKRQTWLSTSIMRVISHDIFTNSEDRNIAAIMYCEI